MRLSSKPASRLRPKCPAKGGEIIRDSAKTRTSSRPNGTFLSNLLTLSDPRHPNRKNVVYPVALQVDSHSLETVGALAQVPSATTGPYRVKVQILHGLDLCDPCTAASCTHPFLPVAMVAVKPLDEQQQSCAATQHGRNHTLWKTAPLEFREKPIESPSPRVGGKTLASYFSVYVALSSTCVRRGFELPMCIGATGELRMPVKEASYEVAQFFPIWHQLSSNSAIGPYVVGRLKLRIIFELEKIPPAVSVPAAAAFKLGEPPGRPSFLPANFGEALNLKRKQLKATVAPDGPVSADQARLRPLGFDAAASEKIMSEIEGDGALVKLSADRVQFLKPIGEGIHSSVFHGRMLQSTGGDQSSDAIAIKEFCYKNAFPPPNVLATFRREYQLLDLCTRGNACHIVKYLGVLLKPRPAIITEFFPRGSLAACMKDGPSWCQISLLNKTRIALQIAKALNWLHRHGIIHRDIKSHNILLDRLESNAPIAKICDVGSAIVLKAQDPLPTEEVGSSGYTAPEIFTGEGYTCKVDVWSFGIVVWELLLPSESLAEEENQMKTKSNKNPFVGLAGEQFVELSRRGTRPSCCDKNRSLFEELLQRCWMFEPDERPSMDGIVDELEAIYSSLMSK